MPLEAIESRWRDWNDPGTEINHLHWLLRRRNSVFLQVGWYFSALREVPRQPQNRVLEGSPEGTIKISETGEALRFWFESSTWWRFLWHPISQRCLHRRPLHVFVFLTFHRFGGHFGHNVGQVFVEINDWTQWGSSCAKCPALDRWIKLNLLPRNRSGQIQLRKEEKLVVVVIVIYVTFMKNQENSKIW